MALKLPLINPFIRNDSGQISHELRVTPEDSALHCAESFFPASLRNVLCLRTEALSNLSFLRLPPCVEFTRCPLTSGANVVEKLRLWNPLERSTPTTGDDALSAVQLYIGIGQAF